MVTAGNFVSERICPIFQVSNVTGEGLDLLKNFLNVLPISQKYNKDQPGMYGVLLCSQGLAFISQRHLTLWMTIVVDPTFVS